MPKKPPRLFPLDALRGLIMVLMALDHANHFVAQGHSPGEYWGGSFPAYHSAFAFVTRFVTHLAAPGFFFLMGAGMLLFTNSRQKSGWNKGAVIAHFMIRGGLLIALQFLVVNRAWGLSPGGWGVETYVGVLFALGGTMILGSLLLWLPPSQLLILTALLFIGTEFMTPAPSQWSEVYPTLQRMFLVPGGDLQLWVNYPVLPWLELVALGIYFGHWLVKNPQKGYQRAWQVGAAFLVASAVIRDLDGFGNIRPRQGNSWIDILNMVKYPPSMTFTLLTVGINLVLLTLFAQASAKTKRILQPLVVFGNTPLFFYLSHLFLYAGLGWWFTPKGTSLPRMYIYWLLGLSILYPICLWYGNFKRNRPQNSILRFF